MYVACLVLFMAFEWYDSFMTGGYCVGTHEDRVAQNASQKRLPQAKVA